MESGTTSISNLPSSNQVNSGNNSAQNMLQNNQNINLITQELDNNANNMILQQKQLNQQINQQMPQQINQQMPQQIPQQVAQQINQENTNYNDLINGIQKAAASGVTTLPSRDIPIDPAAVQNDNNVKPNYIPKKVEFDIDYIKNMETPEDLINQNNKQEQNINKLELFYSELQLPILLALLFFIFQLPIFKKYIKKSLPMLFSNDGNLKLNGYVFTSVLFAGLFYLINKTINNLVMYV